MEELRFTVSEMLSMVGVFQCVYILVGIVFRVRTPKQAILPVLYFLVLGGAFFLDFARAYIGALTPYYDHILWAMWMSVIPLSVLLILQIVQLTKLPDLPYWIVLGFVPFCLFAAGLIATQAEGAHCTYLNQCPQAMEWLQIMGLICGALSLLLVWGKRKILDQLHAEKSGKERYWLVLSLIVVNVGFLAIFAIETGYAPMATARTVLGLAFIYIVTTSLFRIYPQALVLQTNVKKETELTANDQTVVEKIQQLITMDKVYHEPSYSRADMAKELGISEAVLSKIINQHYKKSLPQVLNEQRIADAKRLLLDTDANIKIVAQEVGFNSIATFNRVFKELEGRSASDYRKNMIK